MIQIHTYAFILGREWRLSLAELIAVFGPDNLLSHNEEIAIFSQNSPIRNDIIDTLGGTIRIIEILGETDTKKFPTDVIKILTEKGSSGKIHFALGTYGETLLLDEIGLRIKKTLASHGIATRYINPKNSNINAATFKKEKLGKTGHEINVLSINKKGYIGKTVSCQDIDAYTRRDIAKNRDMIVGMMPPKLVQMMFNIALGKDHHSQSKLDNTIVYDPFCGLGTTLIEAAQMGYIHLFGSDIALDMVDSSKKSFDQFIQEELVWQNRIKNAGGTPKRDFSLLTSALWQMDARNISHLEKYQTLPKNAHLIIISEGYLGEIMTRQNISLERAQSERIKLQNLYDDFFRGLNTLLRAGSTQELTLVMSFPFWNIHGTYSYFTELDEILKKYDFQLTPLIPRELELNTKKGTLLYRRESQTVGREIVKIEKKTWKKST